MSCDKLLTIYGKQEWLAWVYKEAKHKAHYLPKFYQEQKEIALQLPPGKMNNITADVSTFIPMSGECYISELSHEEKCFEVNINSL